MAASLTPNLVVCVEPHRPWSVGGIAEAIRALAGVDLGEGLMNPAPQTTPPGWCSSGGIVVIAAPYSRAPSSELLAVSNCASAAGDTPRSAGRFSRWYARCRVTWRGSEGGRMQLRIFGQSTSGRARCENACGHVHGGGCAGRRPETKGCVGANAPNSRSAAVLGVRSLS